jgi:hypothetical protein
MIRKLRLALCTLCAAAACQANLLLNPGFETGNFTGWTVGGTAISGVATAGTPLSPTAFSPNVVDVRSGNFAAFGIVHGLDPVPLILTQTVSVTPGTDYDIGFYFSNDSSSVVGYSIDPAHMEIFVNGVAILPAGNHIVCPDCLLRSDMVPWNLLSATWNSGASTAATVSFQIVASGPGFVGLSIDDAFVDAPEPSAFALMAGSLALLVLWCVASAGRRPV